MIWPVMRPAYRWGADAGEPARRPVGRSGRGLVLGRARGVADLDRVVDRVQAPLEPAAVVDGRPRKAHQRRVEPRLARPPARAAVEREALVRRDPVLGPIRGDLGVGPHRVLDRPVVLHVVGVRPAVAPDVTADPTCRPDVVVAAHGTDVLTPGPD